MVFACFLTWFSGHTMQKIASFLTILYRKQASFRHTIQKTCKFSDILCYTVFSIIPRCSAITRLAKAPDLENFCLQLYKKKFLEISLEVRRDSNPGPQIHRYGALDRSAILTADERASCRSFYLSRARSSIQTLFNMPGRGKGGK